MKKTLVIILLLVLIVSLLSGCTDQGIKSVNTDQLHTAQEKSDPKDSEENINKEDPIELNIALLNFGGDMPNKEQVAAAMSDITMKAYNAKIQLLFFDPMAYSQQLTLSFTSGEQIDLFNVFGVGFSNCITNGYVVNLEEDELIQTYGQGIIETMGEIINGGRLDGTLYGIPSQRDMARGTDAFVIAAQYLDGIGYDYTSESEIIYTDLDEINEIFANLHVAYPEISVITPQVDLAYASPNIPVDQIGGDSFGVLFDYGQELEVRDLFSSDVYRDYCMRYYEWNQMGYISGDAATNDLSVEALISSGVTMSYTTTTKPGKKAEDSKACDQEIVIFQLGEDFMRSDAAADSCWVIGENTADRVASMQVLDELYSNPEFSTLICYGIEGEEYVYTEDGHITYPEGMDVDTPAYRPVTWFMPNQSIAPVWEGNSLDLHIRTKEFNENAVISMAFGFSFDKTSKSTVYTALQNVFQEYTKQLEYGFLNPDTAIPEMVERLKASGLDEYIAEKQRQLDEWLDSNGISR